ncbi:MAG: isocitrate lyase/PEP mutase family protein [Betaproteobacteria bacterium]|nr:isocitrate lyase/PEP mutase family protein [Betaproteobacteria bacterium]
MQRMTTALRKLVDAGKFLELPTAYDAITGRLIQSLGFKSVYVGGFVTGGSTAISEPQLTMNEQIGVASRVASGLNIPVVMDAGAGWGEPLHTMRTIRECIRAGVAGVHIEDQLFPKRAHYHTYVAHNIPFNEFRDKIKLACAQRDEVDKDFVIIARSDACREQGYKEAVKRMLTAREVGADMGLIFPRNHKETVSAPKDCKLPLVYVQSRGNRDNRPLYSNPQLKDMGYAGCIDAILAIGVQFHHMRKALIEIKKTGDYTGMTNDEWVTARHDIETLIGLDDAYRIERETVEKAYYAKLKKKK